MYILENHLAPFLKTFLQVDEKEFSEIKLGFVFGGPMRMKTLTPFYWDGMHRHMFPLSL